MYVWKQLSFQVKQRRHHGITWEETRQNLAHRQLTYSNISEDTNQMVLTPLLFTKTSIICHHSSTSQSPSRGDQLDIWPWWSYYTPHKSHPIILGPGRTLNSVLTRQLLCLSFTRSRGKKKGWQKTWNCHLWPVKGSRENPSCWAWIWCQFI